LEENNRLIVSLEKAPAFIIDENGRVVVNLETSTIAYDEANDRWKAYVENMPAFVFDSDGYVMANLGAGAGYDDTNGVWLVGVKGSVGYESPLDAFFNVKKGHRWNTVVYYTGNLEAGASYTSATITAQDSSVNNYTEIRISLYSKGASSVTVKVQQSVDGSTWREFPNQSVTKSADGNGELSATLICEVFRPYIRIVEINNDTSNAQTVNDLYVVLL